MSDASEIDDRIEQLADEFAGRFRRGERPSIEEYAARYPDIADRIRKLLPVLAMMESHDPESGDPGSPARPPFETAPMLERLGDFRILREVGRGGMGIVYEAEQESLGRHVAVKVLSAASLLDTRHLQRFERERRAAARLHHTNIVPVFGVGEEGGLRYYVMQFIRGLGLDEVLDDLRRLRDVKPRGAEPADSSTPADAVTLPGRSTLSSASSSGQVYWKSVARLGVQVAEALEYAHGQGVLHRDVKPSNLLLDSRGAVWVTDFGLAKDSPSADSVSHTGGHGPPIRLDLTHTGDVVGTLRYMAPERFQGGCDARSDIYSLGLTLYELLTLRPAFDESDRQRLIRQVIHDEPRRPRKLDPEIPRDLETIVEKAIAREPKQRYQSARALSDDLSRFLDEKPIVARRVGVWERARKWARRRPAVAALTAAVVAVSLLGIGGVVWQWRSAESARGTADRQRERAEGLAEDYRAERDTAEYAAYRANVAAAASALDSYNVPAARHLLDDAPPQYRNWEWRYLESQLDNSVLKLALPEADVIGPSASAGTLFSVRFSADSRNLMSLAPSGVLRTWDLKSGETIAERTLGKGIWSTDGRWYFAIDDDSVRVMDLATGEDLVILSARHVRRVTLTADRKYIATAAEIGDVRLWDAETGTQLATLREPAAGEENDILSFSPDGQRLIAGLGDGRIHVWEVPTGRRVGPADGTYVESVNAPMALQYAISPGGDVLICTGSYPLHQLTFTNLVTGELIAKRNEHANTIYSVALSPDGRRVASASQDRTVRIWDAATGEPLHVLRGHLAWVMHVAFTADGSQLVSTANDGTSRIWNVAGGDLQHVCYGGPLSESYIRLLTTVFGGQPTSASAAVSPDGTLVASADPHGTIRLWSLDRPRVLCGHTSFVYDAAFSPDGSQIVSGSWDDTIRFWDTRTGRQTRLLRSDKGHVFATAFSPDGRTLATGWRNGTISLWDIERGAERHQVGKTIGQLGTAGAGTTFGPNGIVAVPDYGVSLFDVQTGDSLGELELDNRGRLYTVAFSPDGKLVAAGGDYCSVVLWNLESRQRLFDAKSTRGYTLRVAFHPTGKLLAACDSTGKLHIWDLASQREIATIEHPGFVFSISFTPDGTRLASGCQDGSIRLWDTFTWQQVLELRGHTDYVHSVSFSPDGTQLLSASGDTTVRIWDTAPMSYTDEPTVSSAHAKRLDSNP